MKHQAGQIMTKEISTIAYWELLEAAMDKMKADKIRHLPVVDERHQIIGIISDRDLQRAMNPRRIDNGGATEWAEIEFRFDPNFQVKDFMSFPVMRVRQDSSVSYVAHRMMSEKVSAFLVVDEDVVVGIVTTDDMLKLLTSLLAKDTNLKSVTLASLWEDWEPGIAVNG